MKSLRAGILIIGDEILQGFTQDTNSNFLARRLTGMGHKVEQIRTVPDDLSAIGKNLKAMMKDGLDLLIICGGLGSTPDDVTIKAISKALGLPLFTNKRALEWIRNKVAHLHSKGRLPTDEVGEPYLKMALLPKGSRILFNKPGMAPGMFLRVKGKGYVKKGHKPLNHKIIVMPGVPRELEYIFKEEVEGSILKPTRNRRSYQEIRTSVPESLMHHLLKKFIRENPEVSIGSYPQDTRMVIIRISGEQQNVLRIRNMMKKELKRKKRSE